MKKIALLTLSLSFLIILPATAQLGKVWTDFKSYSNDLQKYFTDNVNVNGNDSLKLELQSEYAIPNVTGEFKIPNPFDTGENDRFLNSISDKFENNPEVRSTLVSNERNRLITRSSAAGILGEGQNRSKTKLQDTENRLENIGVFDAQDETENNLIGQIPDFIRNLAQASTAGTALTQLTGATQVQTVRIQREQVKIVAETLGQTIQTNQSLQYTNLNLANLSQQMEDTNRARRVDASAEAARLLRTTSQTDLFGRKVNN
ncbi:MAG: hypothetical protein KME31_31330 [Tolypothrix carrinoi HA7290-LM1]|jgi:hypothetical protein|nr:hypothetical protein [Tolypothrix carrinoi HA7290-LM1]